MLASKFLRSSSTLISRNVFQTRNSVGSVRRCHVAGVPARNKLSFGEKAVYAAMLSVSMWFVPAWVLYHLPDYQNENRNEYTGK